MFVCLTDFDFEGVTELNDLSYDRNHSSLYLDEVKLSGGGDRHVLSSKSLETTHVGLIDILRRPHNTTSTTWSRLCLWFFSFTVNQSVPLYIKLQSPGTRSLLRQFYDPARSEFKSGIWCVLLVTC